jgi:hypothetical protein
MRWIPIFAVTALLIAAACRQELAPQYVLRVTFNERYPDAAGRAVEDAVHRYDPHATVLLQETFPPVAVATFRSRDTRACASIIAELKPRPDVASVDCRPREY